MKNNAILRIIIWSLVIVLLLGIFCTVLLFQSRSRAHEAPAVEAATLEPVYYGELNPSAVATAEITVYSAPTTDSTAIAAIGEGSNIQIGRTESVSGSQWAYITQPSSGWILMENVELLGSENEAVSPTMDIIATVTMNSTATVTATAVNVRSAPSSESPIVACVEENDTVTIGRTEQTSDGDWAYITSPVTGWMNMEYLQLSETAVSAPTDQPVGISEDIREIEIDWTAGNILIQAADVETIQISESEVSDAKYAMQWRVSGSKLSIDFCEEAILSLTSATLSKALTVYVPMETQLDSLEIDAASAEVTVENLSIGEVEIDTASGACEFAGCVVDRLELDTMSGNLLFQGTLDVLECDAASADVTAFLDNVPSRVTMDSMSGDLGLNLPDTAGFTVSMDTMTGDFISNFGFKQQSNGDCVCGDGACRVNFSSMSGMVVINKNQEAAAVPDTTEATTPSTVHVHSDTCTSNPDFCPDNTTHHTESHHG